MKPFKIIKDSIAKAILGEASVPRGLFDLSEYFRVHGTIAFDFHKEGDVTVAVSNNFRYGSIITQGKNFPDLDRNIKDAILTAFEVPSSYAREAKIRNVEEKEYALA